MPSPVSSGANAFPFTLPTAILGDNIPDIFEQMLVLMNQQCLSSIANYAVIKDNTDNTKQILFDASSATASTAMTLKAAQTANRTLTLPDATDTLVGKATTDTLTNKTLTSPVMTSPSLSSPSIVDGTNVTIGTGTGSIIGQASSKLGFFGAAAVPQIAYSATVAVATTAVTTAAGIYGFTTAAQAGAIVALVNALRAGQVSLGFGAT